MSNLSFLYLSSGQKEGGAIVRGVLYLEGIQYLQFLNFLDMNNNCVPQKISIYILRSKRKIMMSYNTTYYFGRSFLFFCTWYFSVDFPPLLSPCLPDVISSQAYCFKSLEVTCAFLLVH